MIKQAMPKPAAAATLCGIAGGYSGRTFALEPALMEEKRLPRAKMDSSWHRLRILGYACKITECLCHAGRSEEPGEMTQQGSALSSWIPHCVQNGKEI
jgi:hypothetical protein